MNLDESIKNKFSLILFTYNFTIGYSKKKYRKSNLYSFALAVFDAGFLLGL